MEPAQGLPEFVRSIIRDRIGDKYKKKLEATCDQGLLGVLCCASEVDRECPWVLVVLEDLDRLRVSKLLTKGRLLRRMWERSFDFDFKHSSGMSGNRISLPNCFRIFLCSL